MAVVLRYPTAGMSRFVVAIPGLVVLGLGLYACSVYDESLLDGPKPSGVPKDQWGSGVGWWSSKRNDGCISAGVPTPGQRPKDAVGDGVPPLYFAVRSMALGSLDRDEEPTVGAWKKLGFDLDGLCSASETCQDAPFSPACHSIGAVVDGHECRDNSFGKLEAEAVTFEGVGKQVGLSNDGFNCALCRGDYTFLIKISEWNGKDNDSNVRIDLYPSPGITEKPSWACDLDAPAGAWKTNPCWGPSAEWTIQDGTFEGAIPASGDLPNAKLNDPSAYVRDGYVVGQLPADASFWFPGESAARAFPLKIQGGIFAGKLVKDGEAYRIDDGTIAGRAKTSDLVQAFRDLGVCEAHEFFGPINFVINQNADILANGAISPEASCDAVSLGIGFRAEQATFSRQAEDVTPLPGCPVADAGAD